ncbi:VOC family protein [Aliikangiella coralliicola]|uniref:Lactoylglutathione lyase n=1 Tax=Aliikangiella coralliicola TaxID=2592383 RepID=A0A545UGW6_9GAMM|nr:VOC family protein [Aliikangiella coralliicola]TQV88710.1 lactoylglutathione lyase [Aliikangiella coralliicola]
MKFLHSMIRTNQPQESIHFYTKGLGLKVIRQNDYPEGKFSLYFIAESENAPMIELTHNWDEREYVNGDQFGHLAFAVDDIYATCQHLMDLGVTINRPPRDGRMAFVKDPNGISIELLQNGESLPIDSPWKDMPNIGSW